MSGQLSPIPLLGYREHTTPKNGNLKHASNTLHVLTSFHGSKLLFLKNFQLIRMQHIMAKLDSTFCNNATYMWEINKLKYQSVQLAAMRMSLVTPGKCDISFRWNMKYSPVHTALLNDLWMDISKRCICSCSFRCVCTGKAGTTCTERHTLADPWQRQQPKPVCWQPDKLR